MNVEKLITQLIKHEGERLKPYLCPAGKLTIGVGRNLDDKGISKKESRYMLANDIEECKEDMYLFFAMFDSYPEDIQHVLLDMRFQLGHGGFKKFKKMIAAFQKFDLKKAVKEMKDSLWYEQTHTRANNLIKMVNQYIRSEQ